MGKKTIISLFTCGMGMDIGFEKSGFNSEGFETRFTNDITKFACDTIRENRKNTVCEFDDIANISSKEILKKSGLEKNKVDVIIGGPPCQSFSTAGLRKGFDDKRGVALLEYIRVIRDIRPKFFVFENVPGLKSMAKKHIGFYERASMDKSQISKDSKQGSLFEDILAEFEKISGYKIHWEILNTADFGVPQKRKRLVLIGSRILDPKIVFDEIKNNAKFADPEVAEQEKKKPWNTLKTALRNLDEKNPEFSNFPKSWAEYLKHVPEGGCWRDLPEEIRNEAMGGAADSEDPKRKGKQGGRTGFYRRLSWDKPAPTLVTSPSQLATCICHPKEDRPLTVREYARIQGFPDSWKFVGSTSQKYRMIGEAVPVEFAKIIGDALLKFLKDKS